MKAKSIFIVFVLMSMWGINYSLKFNTHTDLFHQDFFNINRRFLLFKVDNADSGFLWKTLDLKTGELRDYDVLNIPDIVNLFPPRDVYSVKIAPDGGKIAYVTMLKEPIYKISSQDGMSTLYAPVANFRLVYVPGKRKWVIEENNARTLTPLRYYFVPSQGENLSYIVRDIETEQISEYWSAELSTKEISTVVVVSTDGRCLQYFPDRMNEWQYIGGWLNDDVLWFTNFADANFLNPYTDITLTSDQTVLIHSETGEKIVSGDSLPEKDLDTWAPIYSPSMRYIAYLGGNAQKSLIVFDRWGNDIIVRIPISSEDSIIPMWVDDAHIFLVINSKDTSESNLLLVNIDGHTQQLAHLRAIILDFPPPQLSHDKRFVLLWTPLTGSYARKLLVFDIKRKKLYDFDISFPEEVQVNTAWLHHTPHFVVSTQHDSETEILFIDILHDEISSITIPVRAELVGEIMFP